MRPLPHLTKIPGLCLLLLTMACDSSTSSPAQQTVSDGQVEADTGGRDGEIEDANSIPSPDSTPTSPDVATFDAMASDASVLDAQADATRPTDGPVAVDNDNDGHPENVDCDDNDATRFPGAPERCNAIDDDCDDSVDEGETVGDVPTWYRDVDEEGRGDEDRSVDTCLAPEGFVAEAGDCNDGDAQINVGAPERCNAIDDDCDDSVDEGET
ncbi:MAG: putative metal-binding motif-containing protein, partial [Bradymonadia bacterium]